MKNSGGLGTIKVILYIITLGALAAASYPLLKTGYVSITHLSGYTASQQELNYIVAAMLEIIIGICIAFFFFIPLGDSDNKENIYYLIDTMASSIDEVITNWNDQLIRKEKLFILMTNSISYLGIMAFYSFLIFKIVTEPNGLKAAILLIIIFVFIKLIDFVNNIIKQLDKKSSNTPGPGLQTEDGMSVLKRKLIIIVILILILMGFTYALDSILTTFFNMLDGPLSFLDASRQLQKD